MEKRLDRLETLWRRRGPTYDVSGLNPREQDELDLLLAPLAAVQRAMGVTNDTILPRRQRARCRALLARVRLVAR